MKCFANTQVTEEQFISFKEKIVNRLKDQLKKQSELCQNILTKLFRKQGLTALDLLEKIEKLTFSEFEESFKNIDNFTRYSTLSREPTDNQLSLLNVYQFEDFSFSRAVEMSLINVFHLYNMSIY
ncbi:hypothetical protein RF11_12519 [Thelohanellus kitauei]|uniref:Uncharacterized protein n=1 Tax=Thelohanellus kitauei TaxID=669202 RepID=A0A0C2NGS7_THEKT|nr:hypothetical protein RF11_12519 [Thelohanellus kitauei]